MFRSFALAFAVMGALILCTYVFAYERTCDNNLYRTFHSFCYGPK